MTRTLDPDRLIRFHRHVARLKTLPRRGWQARGVSEPESVADHTLGLCALALITAAPAGLDPAKVLTMAVLHDLCEALTGDIIPADNVDPSEKLEREKQAMAEILDGLDPDGKLMDLWLDCELQRTAEGRRVKQLDTLEMVLQARLYQQQTGADLTEFFEAAKRVDLPELEPLARHILAHRPGQTGDPGNPGNPDDPRDPGDPGQPV